jgi:photosystem II stability/assembly factor-like uncharacterized protein/outer membrane murein-binding lipoprotein Lpp
MGTVRCTVRAVVVATLAIWGSGSVATKTSAATQVSQPAAHEDAFTFHGSQGATHTFALQGGRYVIDAYAGFFAATHPGATTCSFTAVLNGAEHPVPNGQSTLGSTMVNGFYPYKYLPTLNLAACHYTLVVSPITDCDWSVSIGGGGTGRPFVAFADTGIYHMLGGSTAKTTIVETNGKPYSFGFAYNAWGDGFNTPTARLDLLQHGRVLYTYPLAPSVGSYGQSAFTIDLKYPHQIGEQHASYVARYTLTLGGRSVVKKVPYTVQAIAPGHWTIQPAGTAVDLANIACPTPSLCISPGLKTTVIGTTDGRSWTARHIPLQADSGLNLYGVTCPTARTCLVVGDQYFIIGTKDGGRSWTNLYGDYTYTSYGQNLIDVSCPTERRCYAVGTAGIILTTKDGGAHWTSLARFSSGKDLSDITCPTETRCYIVGMDGVIKRTTNGGLTWDRSTVKSPHLLSVDCPALRICYAAGEQGTIVATTDGGKTWMPQNNPLAGSQLWIDSVSCSTTLVCHAVGQGGTLLLTTDGGKSWRDQTSPTGEQLNVVSCPNAHTCFAVGKAGTIVKGS